MKRSEVREGERRGWGELAKLPICTREAQISSGTLFLCDTIIIAWRTTQHSMTPPNNTDHSVTSTCLSVCVCVWVDDELTDAVLIHASAVGRCCLESLGDQIEIILLLWVRPRGFLAFPRYAGLCYAVRTFVRAAFYSERPENSHHHIQEPSD